MEERKVISLLAPGVDEEEMAKKADLVDGKVPASQLPSYVDDVVEYENVEAFPEAGEQGKIYVALDSGFTYRWSGSEYIQIGGQDLSDYYTKGEADQLLDTKQPVGDYATNSALEAGLATKQDVGDYATSAELTAGLALKANTADVNAALAQKQDVIIDLSTIREGAALGATAVQPTDISPISELEVRRLFRTEYDISTTILNGSYSGDDSIWTEETATVIVEANSGYIVPETVAVSGAAYTYNDATGVITLSAATGNVSISAECEMSPSDLAKGDIIHFDALGDGTQKRFRVIDVNNGNVVKLLGLDDLSKNVYNTESRTIAFDDGSSYQNYEGSTLDTYLNTTYYNSLSSIVKSAIIDETFVQSCYAYALGNDPSADFYVNRIGVGGYLSYTRITQRSIGLRHIHAFDMDEIKTYFNIAAGGTPGRGAINKLFFEQTGELSRQVWMASAYDNYSNYAYTVSGNISAPSITQCTERYSVRPVFKINLSTIAYTKE